MSARGLAHSIMQNVYFPMVLNKQYSMPNEALMSSWVPHGVPFGSCQQQEWSINGRFVEATEPEVLLGKWLREEGPSFWGLKSRVDRGTGLALVTGRGMWQCCQVLCAVGCACLVGAPNP